MQQKPSPNWRLYKAVIGTVVLIQMTTQMSEVISNCFQDSILSSSPFSTAFLIERAIRLPVDINGSLMSL